VVDERGRSTWNSVRSSPTFWRANTSQTGVGCGRRMVAGPPAAVAVQLHSAIRGASTVYTFEAGKGPHRLLYTTPLRIRPGASTRRAKAIRIGDGGSPEHAAGWVVETGPDHLALLGQRPVRGTLRWTRNGAWVRVNGEVFDAHGATPGPASFRRGRQLVRESSNGLPSLQLTQRQPTSHGNRHREELAPIASTMPRRARGRALRVWRNVTFSEMKALAGGVFW